MSPTFCIHKTLDRSSDGRHYCIDCRMPFTIHPWGAESNPKPDFSQNKIKGPEITPKATVSDSEVPRWLAKAYRWLMVLGVLAILGAGIGFYCNKQSQTQPKQPEIAEKPTAPQESCQNKEDMPKPTPECPKIKKNEKKCPIPEPKIVYVPTPNKCECTEAIKAACGESREALKSLLRRNWHDKQEEEAQKDYRLPESKLDPSEENWPETEDLELYIEDDDSDGKGWFKK